MSICRTNKLKNRPQGKSLSLPLVFFFIFIFFLLFFRVLSSDLQDKSVCFALCVLFCVSGLRGNTPAGSLLPAADANRASSQGNVTAPKINSAAQRRVLSLVSCWNVSAKTESHRIKIQLPTSNKEGVSMKGARRLLLFVEFWRRGVRKGEEFVWFFVCFFLSFLPPSPPVSLCRAPRLALRLRAARLCLARGLLVPAAPPCCPYHLFSVSPLLRHEA